MRVDILILFKVGNFVLKEKEVSLDIAQHLNHNLLPFFEKFEDVEHRILLIELLLIESIDALKAQEI